MTVTKPTPQTLKRIEAEVVHWPEKGVSNLVQLRRIRDGDQTHYEVYWRREWLHLGCVRKYRDEDHGWVWEQRWPWESEFWAAYKGNRGEAIRDLVQVYVYNNGTGEDDES
jgi:hypothetical protein